MSERIEGMENELPTGSYSIAFRLSQKENWDDQLKFIDHYLSVRATLIPTVKVSNVRENSAVIRNGYNLVSGGTITIFRRCVANRTQAYWIRGDFVKDDGFAKIGLEAIAGELGLVRV